MWTQLFYNYITNPLQTLERKKDSHPYSLALFSMFLIISTRLPEMTFETESLPIAFLFLFIAFSVLLFFESIIIDFIAQLFKLKAQSLKLFFWLAISFLPLILTVPLHLLETLLPYGKPLFSLAHLSCFIYSLFLQINTIKHLYGTSLKKSIFIYCIPLFLFTGLTSLFIFLTGALIALNMGF